MTDCPCGSGAAYAECCEPIITGSNPAETPERLMRARYSAYVRGEMDFLFESTHPKHREGYDHKGTREWAESAEWLGLEILETARGGEGESIGEVEFIARFKDKGVTREHHELASFKREKGNWYFAEGSMVKPKPISVSKIGRNEPCPCGSGAKYKKCCGK
jgi:SEC-C motif-containing protein